eukprot:6197850-Pleurochrysis_carterae.AAC.4
MPCVLIGESVCSASRRCIGISPCTSGPKRCSPEARHLLLLIVPTSDVSVLFVMLFCQHLRSALSGSRAGVRGGRAAVLSPSCSRLATACCNAFAG